jgi:hypothetical protein
MIAAVHGGRVNKVANNYMVKIEPIRIIQGG